MAERADQQVEVDGIAVAFETHGEGRPILLLHGWSADRRYMLADLEPIFEARPGWRRVYLDLPGHGRTPAPSWLSTTVQMVDVLARFIEAVLPGEPFAVAGNSYGGYLTLGLARSMPERLRGAALLVPAVPEADGTLDAPPQVTLIEDRSIFTDLAPDERWIPDALVVHERRMLEEIRAYDMPGYRESDAAFLARLEERYASLGPWDRPGARFPHPSLIITGRQDSIVGYRGAWDLVEEFPRATFATVDLAGHHLGRIERPEVFRVLVDDWLDRMELDDR